MIETQVQLPPDLALAGTLAAASEERGFLPAPAPPSISSPLPEGWWPELSSCKEHWPTSRLLALWPGSAAGWLGTTVPLSRHCRMAGVKVLLDGGHEAIVSCPRERFGAGPGTGDRDGDVAKGVRAS